MPKKRQWIFEAYLAITIIYALQKVVRLFVSDSPEYLFYLLLRAFDPVFSVAYNAHIMYVALNALHCIPLFCAIYRIRLFNPNFWKFLFILRCIFEVTGQNYQANAIEALYQTDSPLLYFTLAFLIIPQIPSYCVCFMYAFRQERLFNSRYL